jgi:hypothetical protein
VISAVAALTAMATRLPFAARRLWDHDSVQFALGVERYDLAAHHPHPPGYPLYIAILKGLAALGVSSLHGMVALSILAAGLGAGLIVPLTARLVEEGQLRAGRAGAGGGAGGAPSAVAGLHAGGAPASSGAPLAAGILAAALFIFNPILWFYGELPLVYAVEGGMTVGLAWAALRMSDGRGPFIAACAAFALAGGIRPSTLVLLLPLFLFGAGRAWRRGLGIATLAAGAVVGTAVGLAWLLPLLAAAGGLAAYQRIGAEHFSALLPYTSILYGAGWGALAHNLTIMTKWFLQGLLPAAAGLVVLMAASALERRHGSGAAQVGASGVRLLARNAAFLMVWAVPPILFFALFHITKAGYTLVYLPALLVAASVAAAPALAAHPARGEPAAEPRPGPASGEPEERLSATTIGQVPERASAGRGIALTRAGVTSIALAATTGAGLFLFGADRRPDQPRALAVVRYELNRGAIVTYERDLDRLLTILRRCSPATTVLATVELSGTGAGGPESFLYPWQRHLQWYLPEYEVLHLVPEDRLAFATRGHQPFRRTGPILHLPPGTRQLAIVLSGPTGDRFPLAAWPASRIGDTFYLTIIPVTARLRLGPFVFEDRPQQG